MFMHNFVSVTHLYVPVTLPLYVIYGPIINVINVINFFILQVGLEKEAGANWVMRLSCHG